MADNNPLATLRLNDLTSLYCRQRVRCRTKAAKAPATDTPAGQLREACVDLESLFINYLFKEMRATIPKSGFISGGRADELYTSLLDTELSKKISSGAGIGLASLLLKQLDGQTKENNGADSK